MSNRSKEHRNTYNTGLCTYSSRYPHIHLGIYLPSKLSKRHVSCITTEEATCQFDCRYVHAYVCHSRLSCSRLSLSLVRTLSLLFLILLSISPSLHLSLCVTQDQYAGPVTICISCGLLLFFWPAMCLPFCCPCDTRTTTYLDGRIVAQSG